MLEQQLLAEFDRRLRAETAERLADADGSIFLWIRAAALAEVMIGYLEEAGAVSEHEPCPYEDNGGRNRCRILGYALAEESTRLELFTAGYVEGEQGTLASGRSPNAYRKSGTLLQLRRSGRRCTLRGAPSRRPQQPRT